MSEHCRVAFGHISKHLEGVGNRGEARLRIDHEARQCNAMQCNAMQQQKGIDIDNINK
jgi:hypothetical protein